MNMYEVLHSQRAHNGGYIYGRQWPHIHTYTADDGTNCVYHHFAQQKTNTNITWGKMRLWD